MKMNAYIGLRVV